MPDTGPAIASATSAVAAAVENVQAGADAAIEIAEQRASNAEAAAAAIADGAIRTALSERIDDVAEDVTQCREEIQNLRTDIASLNLRCQELATEIQKPKVIEVQTTTVPAPNPSQAEPSIQQPSQPVTTVTTVNPSSESAAVLPVPEQKRKPFRLI